MSETTGLALLIIAMVIAMVAAPSAPELIREIRDGSWRRQDSVSRPTLGLLAIFVVMAVLLLADSYTSGA